MNKSESKNYVTNLDEIIKEESFFKKNSINKPDVETIVVDANSGEILEEPPNAIAKLFTKVKYFQVNRNKYVFDVAGPTIPIPYSNSISPFEISIFYKARISKDGVLRFVHSVHGYPSPIEAVSELLRQTVNNYIFEKNDFVIEFNKYKSKLEDLLKNAAGTIGLELLPDVIPNILIGGSDGAIRYKTFINFEYKVSAKTKDAQMVEINHNLSLTLIDKIKFALSNIQDLQQWIKGKLDQYTHNAIIEMTYAEVLVNMEESVIRLPMQKICNVVGYELKQLVTVPGVEIEKFYFETLDKNALEDAEFTTKDTRLKISLNIVVRGRLNIHSNKTKEYIKPGLDIIAGMKRNVIDYAKNYINEKSPEECYLEQYVFEENLIKIIRSKLTTEYGFKELGITVKFLETSLSKRLALLQERPAKVDARGQWEEKSYSLWFRVISVSEEGWYRFRANNYQDTEEELKDISNLVKNGMENSLLRTEIDLTTERFKKIFEEIRKRVKGAFGLDIVIHDFREELSKDEQGNIEDNNIFRKEKQNQRSILHRSNTVDLEALIKERSMTIQNLGYDHEDVKNINNQIKFLLNDQENTKKSLSTEQNKNGNNLLDSDSSEANQSTKSDSEINNEQTN